MINNKKWFVKKPFEMEFNEGYTTGIFSKRKMDFSINAPIGIDELELILKHHQSNIGWFIEYIGLRSEKTPLEKHIVNIDIYEKGLWLHRSWDEGSELGYYYYTTIRKGTLAVADSYEEKVIHSSKTKMEVISVYDNVSEYTSDMDELNEIINEKVQRAIKITRERGEKLEEDFEEEITLTFKVKFHSNKPKEKKEKEKNG